MAQILSLSSAFLCKGENSTDLMLEEETVAENKIQDEGGQYWPNSKSFRREGNWKEVRAGGNETGKEDVEAREKGGMIQGVGRCPFVPRSPSHSLTRGWTARRDRAGTTHHRTGVQERPGSALTNQVLARIHTSPPQHGNCWNCSYTEDPPLIKGVEYQSDGLPMLNEYIEH